MLDREIRYILELSETFFDILMTFRDLRGLSEETRLKRSIGKMYIVGVVYLVFAGIRWYFLVLYGTHWYLH